MVQIEIQDGPDSGKTFELATGHHSVGRATTNDVVVTANSVSGNHLQLSVSADGTVSFQDLGSTNGTFSAGMKVVEGEWFAGSELKLGDIALKLIDDSIDHQRLRDKALEKPQSSLLMKAVMGLIVVAGVGFAYMQFFATSETTVRTVGGNEQVNTSVAVAFDLIDNLGDFADSNDWQLSAGASISDGVLAATSNGASASLGRVVAIDFSAIKIHGSASGAVYLDIAWGIDADRDRALASWRSENLGGHVVLAMPPLADWMKLSVKLAAGSSLSSLTVDRHSANVQSQEMPMATAYYDKGNLAVVANNQLSFSLSSSCGSWDFNDSGVRLADCESANVVMSIAPSYLRDGSDSRLQIFADGGPIVPSSAMTVDNPAGLLCGTKVDSYYFNFDGSTNVVGNLARLRINDAPAFSFLFNLRQPQTNAALSMQAIEDALDSNDDSSLLSSCQTLLRYYPLDDKQVRRAKDLINATMARGYRELSDLQQQASGALFVGASLVMLELNDVALALSKRFANTEIAVQANDLSQLLLDVVAQDSSDIEKSQVDYHMRVTRALSSVYPNISSWLQEVK